MGLTPIEDRSDGGEKPPRGEATPGVSERLRRAAATLIGSVFGGLGELLAPSHRAVREVSRGGSTSADGPGTREAAIRPSGQARLESGTDRQLPAAPREAGDSERRCGVEAQVRGDTLRIHEPDSPGAYIISDVYERVER